MDRGVTKSAMGIQMHSTIFNQGDFLQPHLWLRCYVTSRTWRASLCREMFYLKLNSESLMASLDLVYELRDKTRVREEASKRRTERKYNSNVKPRSFHAGDLI